jgi:hypothetical protein
VDQFFHKIPGRKATRGEIKHMFKDHLTKLKARLNVSIPPYSGSFLITCRVLPFWAKSA